MTEQEFLDRCRAWYQQKNKEEYGWQGIPKEVFEVMMLSLDYMLRKISIDLDNSNKDQLKTVENDYERIKEIANWRTLAWFKELYNALDLAHALNHPCKICATNPETWFARYGFCPHK